MIMLLTEGYVKGKERLQAVNKRRVLDTGCWILETGWSL